MKRSAGTVSLERALSKLGAASRSEARALIASGRVRMGGRVVSNPSMRVTPESARLTIDGVPARRQAWTLIAFHKPRGVVTTRRDPEGRPTVFDLLGEAGRGLVAVGRLDFASSGLLLFTNDTQLAHRLTDPAARVIRRYVATVRGQITDEIAGSLEDGVTVGAAGGRRERLQAARVRIRKASGRETHLIVELTEGKNREIRRLFAAAGHDVTRLHRIAFGPVELGQLAPGAWRAIDRHELGNDLR